MTIRATISTVATALCVAAAVAVAVALALGYLATPVLTGSMQPVLDPGDLAIVRSIPTDTLEAGQILLFDAPADAPGDLAGERVIHRVTSVDVTDEGVFVRTRGDANDGEDPWTAGLLDDTVQVMAARIPMVGHLAIQSTGLLFAAAAAVVAMWGVGQLRRPPGHDPCPTGDTLTASP